MVGVKKMPPTGFAKISCPSKYSTPVCADTALSKSVQEGSFRFCELKGTANVLIFPDLGSANIASHLMTHAGGAECIGPLTLGLSKPINVLHPGSDVEDVVNASAVTVIECLGGML